MVIQKVSSLYIFSAYAPWDVQGPSVRQRVLVNNSSLGCFRQEILFLLFELFATPYPLICINLLSKKNCLLDYVVAYPSGNFLHFKVRSNPIARRLQIPKVVLVSGFALNHVYTLSYQGPLSLIRCMCA